MTLRVAMVGLRAPGAEGGVEGVVAELGPRLVRLGCDVTVFCRPKYRRGDRRGEESNGMHLVDVPTVYTKHLEALVHTGLVAPRLSAGRFDVVHVHAVGNALWSFAPRARGVPVVVTAHGLDWRREKWGRVARAALRAGAWTAGALADDVIAVSEEVADAFRGVRARVHRIPNGVSPIERQPIEAAGVPGLKPGFVLYLGRIVPEKDLPTLLRAHAAAKTGRTLVVAGSHGHAPEHLVALERMAGPDVRFVGPRFGDAKAALFHHAAAVAYPSRLEGLPLALLEAMACGRPALVSDIRPHRELLPDGHAVFLPPGDVPAWTAGLRRIGPDLAPLGARARDRALSQYGWDPIARRTLGVYEAASAAGR